METNNEDWENNFEAMFGWVSKSPQIKDFISQLLSIQEEKIRAEERKRVVEEIEKMKQEAIEKTGIVRFEYTGVYEEIINKINNK